MSNLKAIKIDAYQVLLEKFSVLFWFATVKIEKLDMRACRGYPRAVVIVSVLENVELLRKTSHNDRNALSIHDMVISNAWISTTCQACSRRFFARLTHRVHSMMDALMSHN
jgi:hypothetical protein